MEGVAKGAQVLHLGPLADEGGRLRPFEVLGPGELAAE